MKRVSKSTALARLTLAAVFIDISIVIMLAYFAYEIGAQWLDFPWTLLPPGAVVLLQLAVTELLFSGNSIGKLCVGLKVRNRQIGAPLPLSARLMQLISKLATLGVPSLNPSGVASYYDNDHVYLTSNLISQDVTTTPKSVERRSRSSRINVARPALRIENGRAAGSTISLSNIAAFRKTRLVKIGRDATWADVALPNEPGVSSQHCVLAHKDGYFYLIDGNGKKSSKPSTRGTFIEGRRISNARFSHLKNVDRFHVGDLIFRVLN